VWSQYAASNLKNNDPVRQTLENQQVCRLVVDLIQQVDPVCHALRLMEVSARTLSEAACIMEELLDRLPKRSAMLEIAKTRVTESTQGMWAAALLMDNRFPDPEGHQVETAMEFMSEHGLREQFAQFVVKVGPWSNCFLMGTGIHPCPRRCHQSFLFYFIIVNDLLA
jgi:hypothetical protein